MARWWRLLFFLLAIGVAALLFYPRTCSNVEQQSIIVEAGQVTVVNLTDQAWTNVDVWLNDQYRGQAAELGPGQRLDMPTRLFVAGFGQRFDPATQSPYGIEVTARSADGQPVKITWGQGRRR